MNALCVAAGKAAGRRPALSPAGRGASTNTLPAQFRRCSMAAVEFFAGFVRIGGRFSRERCRL
jgi:hypothetical protein